MTQPLSGESSVLGTCLISDGFFYFSKGRSKEQGANSRSSVYENEQQHDSSTWSNTGLEVGGTEANCFLAKIVGRADEPDGTAFGSHQNRMSDGGRALG